MRKNSFLTLCFALIPGGGEMYMGMMKKGLAIMLSFWGIIAFCSLLRIEFLFWVLPVIWFYSFFETLNANQMTAEQRREIDDKVTFALGDIASKDLQGIIQKRHALFGGGMILIGVWLLLYSALESLPGEFMPDWLNHLLWRMPGLLVYIAIIAVGVYLVRGKKKTLPEDDFVAYKGDDHE